MNILGLNAFLSYCLGEAGLGLAGHQRGPSHAVRRPWPAPPYRNQPTLCIRVLPGDRSERRA
jgi:hypothetical protein